MVFGIWSGLESGCCYGLYTSYGTWFGCKVTTLVLAFDLKLVLVNFMKA